MRWAHWSRRRKTRRKDGAADEASPVHSTYNVTGQPAVSLPLAESRDGLPIGVQLVAAAGEDAALLSLAAWFERELPWSGRLRALQQRLLSGNAS